MLFKSISALLVLTTLFQVISSECTAKSSAYTTTDGIVIAQVAHIITFTLECANRANPKGSLYADLNGKTLPAVRWTDGNTYQISWTVELSKSWSGSASIPVYDEDGFAQLRKAQRANSDAQSQTTVKPLFTLEVSHSSPYKGPLIQTELVATLAALGLWWLAYTAKTKLTN